MKLAVARAGPSSHRALAFVTVTVLAFIAGSLLELAVNAHRAGAGSLSAGTAARLLLAAPWPALAARVAAGLVLAAAVWTVHRLVARARSAVHGRSAAGSGSALGLLDEIARASSDPVFARDLDGRCILINRSGAALLNVEPARALGRRTHEFASAALAQRIEHRDAQIIERGIPEVYEQEIETHGAVRSFLTIKGPLRGADGRPRGVYGVMQEITALRRDEARLRHLRMAVDQSSESIVITDLAGTIEYVNAAQTVASGCTRAELLGRHRRVLESERTPASTYDEVQTALREGRSWQGLLFKRRQDGSDFVEEAMISPVRMPDGRVTHYLAVKKDVTEQQRMADELQRHRGELEDLVVERTAELEQARRAAEAANEAKSAFLTAMSHELRTPMNGVVSVAELLARSGLTAYQADLVRTISESSGRLLSLVDELLDFAKIEAGKLEVEATPVTLRTLVESTCDTMRPYAAARGVLLHVFVDPALPEQLLLDGLRWGQILGNLLSNAIKFSSGLKRPGRVSVRVDRDDAQALRLAVADNGIGMSQHTLTRIYEPFAQADASTARRYGGTGLGLPIVRSLTDAMHGTIHAASVPDEGSHFTVCVPAEPVAGSCRDMADVDLHGVQCLVCTGDAELDTDWSAYLAAAGAAVESCRDARAVRAALWAPPGGRRAVIGAEWGADLANELRNAAPLGGAGLVLVGRGQRRSPRLGQDTAVHLDADALHRDSLLGAVELALERSAGVPTPDPAAAADAGVDAHVRPAVPSRSKVRVLVAEDDPVNQEVIRQQLAVLGVPADIVDDGEAAFASLQRGGYAMLLSDLQMPGCDGCELARRIRAEERESGSARLPVVALTATTLPSEAERCRDAGMDDYLVKPPTLERLSAALQRWLPPADAVDAADAANATAGGDAIDCETAPAPLPVLDQAALDNAVGADPAAQQRIRAAFVASAGQTAGELHRASADARFADATMLAHRLRGAAAAAGAAALADVCRRIEEACATGDTGALNALERDLDQALLDVVRELQPAAPQPANEGVIVAAPPPDALIVVDDDPFQLELLRARLGELVHVPLLTLRSGTAALAAVERCDAPGVLLLVDLQMPDMDGIVLMRALAAGGYRGAIAFMSAAEERVLESAARLASRHGLRVAGWGQKPIGDNALRELVQRWQELAPATERAPARRYDASELARAIEHGELVLHYQPKLSLLDRTLAGVEALVRWQHPRDGLVYPDAFVGLAEEHGLVDALTDRVLALALDQARSWRERGLAPPIAVNVSMDNLVQLDFADRVLAQLKSRRLAPGSLMLEVTESRLMRDPRIALDILTRLRLRGIGLAIDDFGTGHSSLAQLRDLPFDELKIDRGFAHGCGDIATRRAIVGASAEMARQLGMRSVAEGIEDAADWDAASAAGCDVAQGYFIAKPMPAEWLPAWANSLSRRFGTNEHAARQASR